ncbi:hypothetical protein A9Q94_10260 [Rhodobacterales bacterium 56_14_T64]|nr:hypothetical protein A9Q94_10260 [Rhodobacterales bacterium 56_14_T64]
MFGISAALTTPYTNDGHVDADRLNTHIKQVLTEGCTSVTLFGTTGEGASVPCDARLKMLGAAIAAGIKPEQLVLCLHGAAAGEVIDQVKAALEMGTQRFLLPPPCYFNQPSDQGLFEWFATVLSAFSGTAAQFILYHIPQVIGVGLSVELISRLKEAYPDQVLGVKDSSGSFENSKQLLQLPGLEILVGDERQLAACARIGAAGAISGIANVFAGRLARVLQTGVDDTQINTLVDTVLTFPVTPAVKSLVAHRYNDGEWCQTGAPLEATPDTGYTTLAAAYDAACISE